MKILFITDLDGTLLRSDKTISKESCEILNRLISEGVAFSYATARSIYSASVLTQGINLCAPVITKNGTVIVEVFSTKGCFTEFFANAIMNMKTGKAR